MLDAQLHFPCECTKKILSNTLAHATTLSEDFCRERHLLDGGSQQCLSYCTRRLGHYLYTAVLLFSNFERSKQRVRVTFDESIMLGI